MDEQVEEAKLALAEALKEVKAGKSNNALALCRKAERLASYDIEILFLLGMVHYEIGDFITVWDTNDTLAAGKYFDEVIARDPGCVKAHFYRGMGTLRWGNNYDLALKSFLKALELEPDNGAAAQCVEICQKCKEKKMDEAQQIMSEVLASIGADYSINLRENQAVAAMLTAAMYDDDW